MTDPIQHFIAHVMRDNDAEDGPIASIATPLGTAKVRIIRDRLDHSYSPDPDGVVMPQGMPAHWRDLVESLSCEDGETYDCEVNWTWYDTTPHGGRTIPIPFTVTDPGRYDESSVTLDYHGHEGVWHFKDGEFVPESAPSWPTLIGGRDLLHALTKVAEHCLRLAPSKEGDFVYLTMKFGTSHTPRITYDVTVPG